MDKYFEQEYNECKQWIASKINDNYTWDQVADLSFTGLESVDDAFNKLRDEELIIPQAIENLEQWRDFVDNVRANYAQITTLYGIGDNNSDNLIVPTDAASPWTKYKNYLLGTYSGKQKMSENSVYVLENNCRWILNHLERDTRSIEPVKGLVMGSVQSGKTANMIGLVTMAAHYDWNIFIILSGTIENLRKQTRDRFTSDLMPGVTWRVLDYTSNPEYMIDINKKEKYLSGDLKLNIYQNGKSDAKWMYRYVFVCLKNSKRLQNLITWLHSDRSRAAKMRVVVIDDEADQASVNTTKMGDISEEDEIERTAVNKLIINLVKGCDKEGNVSSAPFQAMNYISFTATPYANVLNEAYRDSLYPRNFICSLPESNEYFGLKAIWGSKSDEDYSGLNITRIIPDDEVTEVKQLNKGQAYTLPVEMQKSIAWFLCASAVLRRRNYKKPISMLIHTTSIQKGHFEEYYELREWLERESKTGNIITLCKKVYEIEKDEFRLEDLAEGYPKYARLSEVDDSFPCFDDLEEEISTLLDEIVNIELNEDKKLVYHENGIHLCVDNCIANRLAEEGAHLRIIYPSEDEVAKMKKAPVFIVMGGNTLSRGLTIEGLVCTYFARNVNQVDTLMQMARWFGYRRGYELLQRIWMPKKIEEKFELIEEIDEKLKEEFEDFMKKGKSPALFGPRIMSSTKIARFNLTSKNKSQNMIAYELDFSGDSYEVTRFKNSEADLLSNITVTDEFLNCLGPAEKSSAIDSSYVWRNIDSKTVISRFLDKYKIFDCSPLHKEIHLFKDWMKQMNDDGKYLKWDIAIAGDGKSKDRWNVSNANVGKIERSKKRREERYIDIGSLRSGIDVLSDVSVEELTPEKMRQFEIGKKSRKNLIFLRYFLGLEDVPLLLLYRIDKDKGNDTKYRKKIESLQDIIGFSIVISSPEPSSDYVKSVTIKIVE